MSLKPVNIPHLVRLFHKRCSSRRKEAPCFFAPTTRENMEPPYVGCYSSISIPPRCEISGLTLCLLLTAVLSAHSAGTNQSLIVPPVDQLRREMRNELRVTRPDYVVFTPQLESDRVTDTGNEHFLVFDGPDRSLMAIWTQSTHEGERDHHIVFSKSRNEGKTWSKPVIIAGLARGGMGPMASWAFPLVSKSGRIYVIYDQQTAK